MARPVRKGTPPPLPKQLNRTTPITRKLPSRTATLVSSLHRLPTTLLTSLTHLPTTLRNHSPTILRRTSRLTLLFLSMYATAALTRSYLLDYSTNTGASMLPTIPTAGSKSIWSPLYSGGRGIKIGDIVQVRSPLHRGQMIGKRVVGMPGDYVLRDENLAATVGGTDVTGDGRVGGERGEPVMVQVPEGHVWLAGDNISWSRDSRFYGPVPMALIKAKTLWHVKEGSVLEAVWTEHMKKVEDVELV